ncbi:MAG: hypothetical protein JST73_07490 [Actinobacteria bacterium]|nr:hypothetical protein [Actinomycetota bacterium]
MADDTKSEKVTTEGSARVLNKVKGRLESMEVGDLPVIERVAADGTTRPVDANGGVVGADAERVAELNAAAEAFAQEHQATAPAPKKQLAGDRPAPPKSSGGAGGADKPMGLWARIKSWFIGG